MVDGCAHAGLLWQQVIDEKKLKDRALARLGAVAVAAPDPLLFAGHRRLPQGRIGAAFQPGGAAVSP
jgi:hypothetical protein